MKNIFSKKIPNNVSVIIIVAIVSIIAFSAYYYCISKSSILSDQPTPAMTISDRKQESSPSINSNTSTPKPTSFVCGSNRPTKSPLNKEVSIGNTNKNNVALTFDAGASATQTPQILDILKANSLEVTFFVTGKWAESNPELIKRMVDDGHTIGNHTYSHPNLTEISDDQIRDEFAKTENILQSIDSCAVGKPYFRPPYGSRNSHVLDVAAESGYQSIYWTIDALDWQEGATDEMVKERIFSNAKNGAVIMMHVGDDITPQVLQDIIDELQSRGYKLGNLESII